jgi:hypothetical protein
MKFNIKIKGLSADHYPLAFWEFGTNTYFSPGDLINCVLEIPINDDVVIKLQVVEAPILYREYTLSKPLILAQGEDEPPEVYTDLVIDLGSVKPRLVYREEGVWRPRPVTLREMNEGPTFLLDLLEATDENV